MPFSLSPCRTAGEAILPGDLPFLSEERRPSPAIKDSARAQSPETSDFPLQMAGRNSRLLKKTYRLLVSGEADAAAFAAASPAAGDELEEADVWGFGIADGGADEKAKAAFPGDWAPAPRAAAGRGGAVAASLPVKIPEWSKILREECVRKRASGCGGDRWDAAADEEEEEEEAAAAVPPHEYLWRKRGAMASFSVHEGVGRTLKGRDLSRVRNAVWRQTGFQD